MATSSSEKVTSRAGVTQLRRRWPADPPAAAVLLVHGMAEHSARYEHVGEFLAGHGYDTLAFDLRGHGASGGRRGHIADFDHFLDDVEHLLDERRELGVPVVLMGHSLGGLICAAYAVSDRPQPDVLVLSAPALAAEVPGWQRTLAPIMSWLAPTLRLPNDFDGALLSRDEDVANAYRDDPLRLRTATTRLGSEVFRAMGHTSEHLHKITVPTYVLHGGDDRLVPPTASEPLEQVSGVTRVVHEGLRHECLNEPEQDEVLDALGAWLADQLNR